MMPPLTRLISDILRLPSDALVYEISRQVADIFSDQYILETEDYDFDLRTYVEAGKCSLLLLEDAHGQLEADWHVREKAIHLKPRNAFYEVQWRGVRMRILTITHSDCGTPRHFILADRERSARDFFGAVCQWSNEVHGAILVYRDGACYRDANLLKEIENSSFDNLILPEALKLELLDDCQGFFESEELYREYGVAWKRGMLLMGPPGNGKTHAIKALMNLLKKPCLYVRGFKSSKDTEHGNMGKVFRRAREIAPCMVVLEDLDALVCDKTRSFFLNEMDGFASNHGILTVATTNHPEKLDQAILERPSRFDRKITFALPGLDERRRYLAAIDQKQSSLARMSDDQIGSLAAASAGLSFAYLKELCVSGLMAWMRTREPGGLASAMHAQIQTLRAQMTDAKELSVEDDSEEEDEL